MVETFLIVPGQFRAAWLIVMLGFTIIVVIGALGAVAYSLRAARKARFEVSAAGLRLRGDFYGRAIPAARLDVQRARAVDLRVDRGLEPVARTLGTGLPGYRAGWFRLRDGQRGLLYVTDPSRVAYVPTRDGYVVLLSVADPAAFVASLRRLTGPPGAMPVQPGI